MIILRKLVTEATNLETRMREYHVKAHDGGYVETPMHASNNGRRWWPELSAKLESKEYSTAKVNYGRRWLFWGCSNDEVKPE